MTESVDDFDRPGGRVSTQTIALAPPPNYPTGTEAQLGNGFAVAGLVLGILPLPPLGILFSILGIVRARVVKVGMTMSIVGLVFSVLWAIAGVVTGIVGPHVAKSGSAGCRIIAQYDQDYPASRLDADRAAGATYIADLQAYQTSLNQAAQVTRRPAVRSAAQTEAADIDIILQYLQQGAQPDPATIMKQQSDNDVLHEACGSF